MYAMEQKVKLLAHNIYKYLLTIYKCQIYLVSSFCRSYLWSTLYITSTDIEKNTMYIVFRCTYYLQFKALSNLQCLLTKHYIFPFVISCLPNVGNILHTCSITTGFFFSFVSQSSFFKTYLVLHRTINKMKFKNVVDKLCLQTVLRPQ